MTEDRYWEITEKIFNKYFGKESEVFKKKLNDLKMERKL